MDDASGEESVTRRHPEPHIQPWEKELCHVPFPLTLLYKLPAAPGCLLDPDLIWTLETHVWYPQFSCVMLLLIISE